MIKRYLASVILPLWLIFCWDVMAAPKDLGEDLCKKDPKVIEAKSYRDYKIKISVAEAAIATLLKLKNEAR